MALVVRFSVPAVCCPYHPLRRFALSWHTIQPLSSQSEPIHVPSRRIILTIINTLITLILIYMTTAAPNLTEDSVTEMLRAIADPVRRRILEMLKQPGCCSIGRKSGLCACDIEREFQLSQPTISHHLGILRQAGLIDAEKVGPWMWYRRNDAALRRLARALGDAL